jgi:hypothetical protein
VLQALHRYPWRNLHPSTYTLGARLQSGRQSNKGTQKPVSGFAESALGRWRDHCCSDGQRESP